MKHQLTPAAAALLAAVLVCGGAGAATAVQPSSAIPSSPSGAESEKKCPPENDDKDGKDDEDGEERGLDLGDSANLDDLEDQVRMTVVDVVDPATPEDEFSAPAAGNRLVSVQFCVENTGGGFFEDYFLDTQIIDEEGQQFDVAYFFYSDAGPHFPDAIRVSPGEAALGFISYEVPKGSEIDKVSYLMPYGLGGGDDQAEWDISEEEQRDASEERDPPVELDLARP
ncbi:DUF4352 domain-containing protein [Streptomyces sp. 6N223]|uniref:DUF4352 domain-containing protein n=1 Tax=Streptomyces sp. 6N223 TaxID=3457412 RepID=UPI003FCFC0B9